MRKALALALVTLVAALGLVVAGSAAAGRATTSERRDVMHEISIRTFKVNKSATVTVFVKILGWKMYPTLVGKKTNKADGGHWHIFVNGKYNNYSANATKGSTLKLKKGDYKITVALVNDDHSPVKGAHPSKAISAMVDG